MKDMISRPRANKQKGGSLGHSGGGNESLRVQKDISFEAESVLIEGVSGRRISLKPIWRTVVAC